MKQLVLIRHGESLWNPRHMFTGWADVPLTQLGCEQAIKAGKALKEAGFEFDKGYSSMLSRSIKTLFLLLEQMDLLWIPVTKTWRLNERQDGALQGMTGEEIKELYGEKNLIDWVCEFNVHPPQIGTDDTVRHPRHDRKYRDVDPRLLPSGEDFSETYERIKAYYESVIKKDVEAGERVVVSAHNHVLHCFLIMFGAYTPEQYREIVIPNSVPLVYEFDDDMNPVNHYYLEY